MMSVVPPTAQAAHPSTGQQSINQTKTQPQAQEQATASTKPAVYLDTEKGRKSVAGYIQSGQITLARAETAKEVEKIIWSLERAKPADRPRGLILDSVSRLANNTIQDVVYENPTSIWDNRKRLVAERRSWQEMGGVILRLLRVTRSLNIPVILTAGEKEREDQLTNVVTRYPNLNPEIISDVVYSADTVLRVYRSNGKRVVRCQPDDHYFAKIRVPDNLPPAPDIIVNDTTENTWKPTITKLNAVTGGLFKPIDDSGELSPVLLYGPSGVGKTRLAVELILSI